MTYKATARFHSDDEPPWSEAECSCGSSMTGPDYTAAGWLSEHWFAHYQSTAAEVGK